MSGNSTSLTLVIGVCENPMGNLPCVQLASHLEPTDVDDAPSPARYILMPMLMKINMQIR